jgi:uncharacterized protein
MATTAPTQPVAARDRIVTLDVLRGFAMVGVLVAYCVWSLGTAPDAVWSPLDKLLGGAVGFAVDGKFYTILAFLFGLGFSLQLERAGDARAAVRTYRRRLAALAGIGLAHAFLLRNGDILFPYAITGFFLIPFRRASDRTIIVSAFIALLLPHAVRLAWEASGIPIPDRPDLTNAPYLVENAAWVRYWTETAIFTWPNNLTLFLFGFLAGRHRLVPQLVDRSRTLAMILCGGLLGGVGLFWLSLNLPGSKVASSLAFTFQNWCLSSTYAATLLLALRSRPGTAMVAPLAPVGRMALTNYLLQAGIIVPLCLAFGWFDTFTPTRAFTLAFAVLLFQLPFSAWWLRRYRFGPAEWVWRLLTYRHVPPLRLDRGDYARA